MKYFLRTIFLFLICGCFFSTISYATSDQKPLRIGYFDFAGYHDYDIYGNRTGYGYEYIHEMAKTTGWTFEYVTGTWESCQNMLENGEIDLLTSAQYTQSRGERFDFSEIPMGTSYAHLTVKSDNSNYTRNDFSSFNNLTIGLLTGNSRNNLLEQYAQDNHFIYTPVYFSDQDSLEAALQENQVDAILTSSLRKLNNEKIIAQFAPSPFYCIVKKGNDSLLNQVNEALTQIEIRNPAYKFDLYNKYYRSNISNTFIPTKVEEEYLDSLDVLKVVASPLCPPVSYFEEGEFKGITHELLDSISNNLGIKIQYIETESYTQSLEMIKNGKADVLCTFETDYSWAERNSLKITSPYLNLFYSMITDGGVAAEFKKIAIVDNLLINESFISITYPDAELIAFPCQKSAVKAVSDGEADVAFIDIYAAAHILESYYPHLNSTFMGNQSLGLSLALPADANPILYSLLDQQISSIDQEAFQKIVSDYTMFQSQSPNLLVYMRKYPVQSIAIISLIATALLGVMGYILYNNRKHSKKVLELAFRDPHTSLWNLKGFEEECQILLSKHFGMHFAIVALDLTKFSIINDTYGRKTGDFVIDFISDTLKTYENHHTIIGHVKADHFIMCLNYHDLIELNTVIETISEIISEFEISKYTHHFHVNIGIYLIDPLTIKKEPITTYIDRAEIAHREAKSNIQKNIVIFDLELQSRLMFEQDIIDHIDDALANNEFMVYYQPKFNMRTNEIIGAEALIRWVHKDHGFLRPDEFVPILEKNSFITEVDFFVLEQVCMFIQKRIQMNKLLFPISVNQSRAHFNNSGYLERLQGLLVKYQIPRNLIELEITESLFDEISNEIILRLKELGFLVSVDDFGSGYSSLHLLNHISVDILKIDKSLLDHSEYEDKVKIVFKKIVEMASDLKLKIICEGVETQEQADFLLSIHCLYAQGYLYSKPLNLEDFLTLLDL